jgi:hypothetical protein
MEYHFLFLKINILNAVFVSTGILKGVRGHNCEFIHLFYNEPFESVYDKKYREFFADGMCDVPKYVTQLITCGKYI